MLNVNQRVLLALPFAALMLAATPAALRQGRANVTIVDTVVSGPVHMLVGSGGNIGLSVGPDGVLMIDDQFADLAPKIQAAIDAAAGAPAVPRYLINSHFHGDHTGGNAEFGKHALIVAHDNVRQRLAEPQSGKPMAAEGLPDVTYGETCSIHFNGERVRLLHVPASHTDGDTVVHFERSNVWHLGDCFFNKRFPFIDLTSGGSVAGLQRTVRALLGRMDAAAKIIPGHGDLATRADLEGYAAMLDESVALVEQALQAQKTPDQIVADKTLAKFESWGWNFISLETFTRTLTNELGATLKERK
jgi:glyoxylase-like metal-dependent hydrolase (beta-lactamase superfamily II)